MNRHLQDIIRYFFSHKVSRDIASRVYDRVTRSSSEAEPALREVWDSIDTRTSGQADTEEAWEQISHKLFGKERVPRAKYWLRAAALWAVPLLLLASTFYFYNDSRRGEGYADVTFIHKFTAYGDCEMVTLPDSTKVWLNGGSTLIYPSRFVTKERNVCLSGEGFFDVAKDKDHPFVVHINQMRLKVLGTTFNVNSYPNNKEITTTLETGRLQLTVEGKVKPYILAPNDQLTYNPKTGEISISKVISGKYSNWRTGDIFFDDLPFDKVIDMLERSYCVKFYVLSGKYSNQTLRAHLSRKDSIADIMNILKMLIPELQYEIKGDHIYVK